MKLRFLDGLRGWGAVVVLLYHCFCDSLPPAPSFKALEKFVPFNGNLAVLVFFVVSGFSLTVRYLETYQLEGWFKILAGRYLRLAIPIFAACLIMHLALVFGAVSPPDDRLPNFQFAFDFQPTAGHLFRFALWDVFFAFDLKQTYIGPLWTMGPELFGSVLVLMAVLSLGRAPWRLPVLAILALWIALDAPTYGTKVLSLFPAGAAIADCYNRGWIERTPSVTGLALLVLGAAQPFKSSNVEAAILLGAIPFTLGCICLQPIRAWLSSPLSARLGEVSFPLYLIHGPVIVLFGEPLMRHAGDLAARVGIDLLIVALSFAAAGTFAPINRFAVFASHRFAALCIALGGHLSTSLRPSS
jgi:peptidoglycan/LPS O-acetylase OafA/YrhL